ncbi:sugar-binding domain-containing protein [Botryobacter ruber]|uniref:sugar-binding domain-containing protein n=1 Tax=Botryobacter ruber TaxID=2171629 RepID=UPI00196A7142|nr:sugar-binding domain-containing protein [Botryobacter ruber]
MYHLTPTPLPAAENSAVPATTVFAAHHKPWALVVMLLLLLALLLGLTATAQAQKQASARTTTSFDKDWQFHQGEAKGAEAASFDDKAWRRVDVPHDWSIEGTVSKDNPTGRGGGYFPNGVGWYRKTFTLPDNYNGRKVFVEFDGIMANSDVWVNGKHLGKRPYGYVSFQYDLTPHLNIGKGKTNVIAVRADNSQQPASRWYTGAGIYRHVRLVATDPVHADHWGVFVTTPEVSKEQATVRVQAKIKNDSGKQQEVTVQTTLVDAGGKAVKTAEETKTVPAGQALDFQKEVVVAKPQLWNLESPHLYKAVTQVRAGKTVLDEVTTPFGIRSFRFEPATGFYLNDKNMKIKGACLHHEAGALGAAVPLRVWEKRLEQLREAGVNAIRTAHNPFAPEFYDLCDRMGFLVMNETFDTWTATKNHGTYGYQHYFKDWWEADTRDVVLRDRNHPSIIIYSVGNEIRDNLDSETGFKTFTNQRDLIHRLDPTRPVTMALFRPNQANVYTNGFVELMDVVGQNYRENELVQAHKDKPERKVIGTENGHTLQAWLVLRDNPFMSGQFIWTGFDYLGEADWPAISGEHGIYDRVGGTKPQTFERQSWWSDKPMVHIARKAQNGGVGKLVSDWTPTDFDTYDEAHVTIFSNCDEVELFLNGKSLGTRPKPANDSPRNWTLTFEKGTIKAVGRNKGKEVAVHELKTAGEPARIVVTADKKKLAHDFEDVSYVTATVVDANGIPCPNATPKISFSLTGPGTIAAVDNGNLTSHEPFQAKERSAYRGEAVAILKASASTGKIVLKATAPGLQEGTVAIEAGAGEGLSRR